MSARPEPRPKRQRPRNQVTRIPERAGYERAQADAVLDAGWLAHVGFAMDGQPFVIPMLYARVGDQILLHGSVASRLLGALASGVECCVTVTHVDGLVLARSHFHHSVNYRSVVVFGRAFEVTEAQEKEAALSRFVDAMLPGRAADARPADRQEAAATRLLALTIADFSVKVRSGGPKDHPDDMDRSTWAGVIPMALRAAAPISAEDLAAGIAFPQYLEPLLAYGG